MKGWQSERVASRLDGKGNRVIVVLPEDSHHQAKVREVIDVMELELGLTPGWLLQRKTFCLGVVLEHSQFAFSQPIPEGRMFASRYCKTDEFLVYTTR
ncbi:unnamed protein product [Calypogeia fissa]